MIQNNEGKLIVFEGISGSGKSTLISELLRRDKLKDSIVTNWFSLEKFRKIASEIGKHEDMNNKLYSLIYALEFYARYEFCIEPNYKNGKSVIAHRYIYSGISHDIVRGTNMKYLQFLYKDCIDPTIVVFMNIKPQESYKRIISYRKPSFFECGLDIEYNSDLYLGLTRFKQNYFSNKELEERFLDFQQKVYETYMSILPGNKTIFIDSSKPINELNEIVYKSLV
ncbi:dTMP kinase [Clostridium tertium]|uniref:dTMP kinase n=1 Tax=Clostridium tertium TaxID=1559 RepID=UPI0024B343E0|nr:hypothetical protein [Clostridium tertium]MDI9216420.1 hypothetical protein [Clostridium tertium]